MTTPRENPALDGSWELLEADKPHRCTPVRVESENKDKLIHCGRALGVQSVLLQVLVLLRVFETVIYCIRRAFMVDLVKAVHCATA